MLFKDCKIGMRVKDNLKIPQYNKGQGTITSFVKNVHGHDIVMVKWDSSETWVSGTQIATCNIDIVS